MSLSYHFSWQDPGAPVLDGQGGSIIPVLKAVLVDGYGTKDPLGWTLEFENVAQDQAVFRNNHIEGTGYFLRFSDNGISGNQRMTLIDSYESMIDVENGLLRCPHISPYHWIWIYKSNIEAGTNPIPWEIIGDDKGFWFLNCMYAGSYSDGHERLWFSHFFGDYVSYRVDNPHNWMLFGNGPSREGYGSLEYRSTNDSDTFPGATNRTFLQRGGYYDPNPRHCHMESGNTFSLTHPGWTPYNIKYGPGDPYMMSVPHIYDDNLHIMGRPPGLFQPIIPRGPVYDPINVIQGNTTIRRFPLRVTNNSYALTGCIALTIGEGFRDVI